jgi:hypothetical protein
MGAPLELIQELDSSISHSIDERRSVMLRHLSDLFLVGSDQYSEEEVDLIDDVFVRLVGTIEQSSRALLSLRLAPIPSPRKDTAPACPRRCHRGSGAGSYASRGARYRNVDRVRADQKARATARHLASQDTN